MGEQGKNAVFSEATLRTVKFLLVSIGKCRINGKGTTRFKNYCIVTINMNLNDAVEENWKSDLQELDVIMELSSEIRREYEGELWLALCMGVGNLTFETQKYRKGKVKVVTRVENSREIFEIYSEGKQLPDNLIRELNRYYQEGRQLTEKPKNHGSRIAAFHLAKANGTISIENCELASYTLKNLVVFE